MKLINNLEPLYIGMIKTNKDGVICSCNSDALKLVNTDNIIGMHINHFINDIKSMDFKIDYNENDTLYLFKVKQNELELEKIFEHMDFGVFKSDSNGHILFKNTTFNLIFEPLNNNIFKIFEKCKVDIYSFSLILKAKKEVIYEIQLSNSKKYNLKLVPSLNFKNEVELIYGFITPSLNINELENKIDKMQLELDKYKSINFQENKKYNDKPILQLHSKSMLEIYSILSNISNKDITILILGQSGTGKSSLARTIHNESIRRSKPFVTINCSALSENLIESELFGYSKGAFTGALSSGKKGLVEAAEGGTLFIDEIGEIPLYLQGKLLELIQEKTYRPVGSLESKTAKIRIIVATNKDLASLVIQKKFREDLYYRVAVAVINIPPLSNHPEDIRVLIDAYTLYFNKKYDINVQLSLDSKKILHSYNWPGNIRELEHIMEFLLVRSSKKTIEKTDLPLDIIKHYEETNSEYGFLLNREKDPSKSNQVLSSVMLNLDISNKDLKLKEHMERCESVIINEYYKEYNSSYKLSKYLNISQTKANRLILKYCK